MTLHIGIAGPVATSDMLQFLDGQPGTYPTGTAGAPLLATLVAQYLRQGHRVTVFTFSPDMPLRAHEVEIRRGPNFELRYLPLRPRAWPMNGRRPGRIVDLYTFERRAMAREIRQSAPDVVHAHWAYYYAWATLQSGRPHVITSHDSPFLIARVYRDFRHGAYRWLLALMAWHVLRQAQCVTTVSPYMVREIKSLCRAEVVTIANPISGRWLASERQARGGRLRVVMVCNGWDARKNADTGLRGFAQLASKLPDAELHLFGRDYGPGDTAERWWLEQGLTGKVFFHGVVTHERMLAEMCGSDVLLHPSVEESFGAVIAEAMAVGLPCVAGQDSGAVPWVVGDAGVLVDVRDPRAIAEGLLRLLSSPSLVDELGRRGKLRVRSNFTDEAVAAAYLRAYQSAVDGVWPPVPAPLPALGAAEAA